MIEVLLALALSAPPAESRLIQTPQGPALGWDYPDAALATTYTASNSAGETFKGTIARFVVTFNGGAPIDVGMPVLAPIAGGKTYAVQVPATIAGKFTVTISPCMTWTPTTNPPTSCFAESTFKGAFELPAAQPKFTIGQRVQVYSGTTSGAGAAVRGGAGFSNPTIAVHPAGVKGSVVAGPTDADGFRWWQIDYDVAPDGWSTEQNLEPCVTNCGPPPPLVDCVVSAWSAWSEWKPLNVTTIQRTRVRTVVQQPVNGGAPCPALVETETKPTPPEVCGDQIDNDFDGLIDEGCPPPVDVCKSVPLKVTGIKWPSGQTGNKSGTWNSGSFILVKVEFLWNPQRAVFTDSRGCSIAVAK